MKTMNQNELLDVNGGQYRHAPSGRTRYSRRTRSQRRSGRRHVRKTLKEYGKAAVTITAIAVSPSSKVSAGVKIGLGLAAYAMQ